MSDFYDKIESVYSDSKNYPSDIQTKDAQFHQTESIAWEYLGTDKVMEELEKLVHKAQAAASTPVEKARSRLMGNRCMGIYDNRQSQIHI